MNRIALQMLLGDRAKYLGLIFGIMFATLLISQQTSIFVGILVRTAGQILDVYEADIWVMDPRVKFFEEIEPLPDTAVSRVRGVPGVKWGVPFFRGQVVARSTDGMLQQIMLLGIDDATLTGAPRKMIMGNLDDLRRPDSVIMDRDGFNFIWPDEEMKLGKVIELNDRRAEIVGFCETTPPFVTTPVVYSRYSNAMKYVPPRSKQLSYVLVKASDGQTPEELCKKITAQTGFAAYTWRQWAWKTVGYILARTGIPINFGITIALGFIVGSAIAGQTFYLFVVENLKQYGALKAIGVSNGRILLMVLLQALVVGVIGYSLGIGLAAMFFEFTGKNVPALRGFFLPWEVAAGAFVAIMTIVLLVSVFSVRKVLVVDPAIVFRG